MGVTVRPAGRFQTCTYGMQAGAPGRARLVFYFRAFAMASMFWRNIPR